MAQYVLTSYVGKQIFGVFNTILAVCANPHWRSLVDSIVLYSTKDSQGSRGVSKGTLEESEKIKSYCEQHGYPPVKIVEFDRTENLATEFVKDATSDGKKVLFNIEGGMNYCVAQYMSELVKSSLEHSVIISDGSVYRTVPLKQSFENCDWDTETLKIPELSVEDIFAIQNVTYEKKEEKTEFGKFVESHLEKRNLPKSLIYNVTLNHLTFDLVWNCGGNHLAFLVSPFGKKGTSQDSDKKLERLRSYLKWAAGKNNQKQIYDFHFYVVCEAGNHIDTTKIQGRGKAIPLESYGYVEKDKFYGGGERRLDFSKKLSFELSLLLSRKNVPEFGKLSKSEEISTKVEVVDNTFITSFGKDPSSTIAALLSHLECHTYLKTVLLLCTPDLIKQCNKFITILKSYPSQFLKHINFKIVKTDVKGRSIPYILSAKRDIKNVEVNATPGTKGQTAFLTLFAQNNDFPVWTLKQKEVLCCNQDFEKFKNEPKINPKLLLSLDRYKVTSNTISKDIAKTKLLKSILKNMSESDSDKCRNNFGSFLKESKITATLDGTSYFVTNDNGIYKKVKIGAFFEDLVNVAFSNLKGVAGDSNVTVKDPTVHNSNQKKYHLEEIDYLFSYKHMFVAVSCKAYFQQDAHHLHKCLASVVKESVSFAKGICRFCLPVMCFINKFDVPDIFIDKSSNEPVGIIDCWDLCDPDRLQDILERLDASINVEGSISAEDDSELTVDM